MEHTLTGLSQSSATEPCETSEIISTDLPTDPVNNLLNLSTTEPTL